MSDSLSSLFKKEPPWANCSCRSCRKKTTLGDSLSLLMAKERPWGLRSNRSLQKSDCERFAPIAQLMTKERRELIAIFHEWITLSLTKTSDSLKKRWGNSQPWFQTAPPPVIKIFSRPKNALYMPHTPPPGFPETSQHGEPCRGGRAAVAAAPGWWCWPLCYPPPPPPLPSVVAVVGL